MVGPDSNAVQSEPNAVQPEPNAVESGPINDLQHMYGRYVYPSPGGTAWSLKRAGSTTYAILDTLRVAPPP